MYYGLPEFQRPGIKVAKHHFEGNDDPDLIVEPTRLDKEAFVERFQKRLQIPITKILDWERCQYTNTQNEDFILDTHPQDERIVIGAGFSGHGFKFGPMTGAILADLAIKGTSNIPGFNSGRFRLS